jgi:hypothetical protein
VISATHREDVEQLSVGAGAGQAAATEVSAANLVSAAETRAYVGEGAAINPDQTGVDEAQSVRVVAGADFRHMAVAGAVSVASGAAAGHAISLDGYQTLTEAFVGATALVNARDEVDVYANANVEVLALDLSFVTRTGKLSAAAAGSTPVVDVRAQTSAYIADAARVAAGSNVHVHANDDTEVHTFAGTGTLSLFTGVNLSGEGESLTTYRVKKNTQAWIGENAVVDAHANGGTLQVVDAAAFESGATAKLPVNRGLAELGSVPLTNLVSSGLVSLEELLAACRTLTGLER